MHQRSQMFIRKISLCLGLLSCIAGAKADQSSIIIPESKSAFQTRYPGVESNFDNVSRFATNPALRSIASNFSGSSCPGISSPVAYQWCVDTTAKRLNLLTQLGTWHPVLAINADGSLGLALDGLSSIILGNTLPYTSGGAVLSAQGSAETAVSIYNRICPGCTSFDGVRGAVVMESGTTVTGTSGIAGYVRNKTAHSGINGNGIGVAGFISCEVDNSQCWGMNSAASDSAGTTPGTGSGRVLQNEADFNVYNTGTIVYGHNVVLQATATPLASVGYICSTNAAIKWGTCFDSPDGVASFGFILGASSASGTNINGQPLLFRYFDGAGAVKTMQLQALPGPNFLLSQLSGEAANFSASGNVTAFGNLQTYSPTMITSLAAFTNGAAAATGTLTNAPTAGNPTKWIPISDNGTTRYIPAW